MQSRCYSPIERRGRRKSSLSPVASGARKSQDCRILRHNAHCTTARCSGDGDVGANERAKKAGRSAGGIDRLAHLRALRSRQSRDRRTSQTRYARTHARTSRFRTQLSIFPRLRRRDRVRLVCGWNARPRTEGCSSSDGCARYDVLRVNAGAGPHVPAPPRHFNRRRSANRDEPPVTSVVSYQLTVNGGCARSFISCDARRRLLKARASPADRSERRRFAGMSHRGERYVSRWEMENEVGGSL